MPSPSWSWACGPPPGEGVERVEGALGFGGRVLVLVGAGHLLEPGVRGEAAVGALAEGASGLAPDVPGGVVEGADQGGAGGAAVLAERSDGAGRERADAGVRVAEQWAELGGARRPEGAERHDRLAGGPHGPAPGRGGDRSGAAGGARAEAADDAEDLEAGGLVGVGENGVEP